MNRFICIELEGNQQNAINFGLFKTNKQNADSLIIDGVNLPQYENLNDMRNIENNYYRYGTPELLELFEFRSFDPEYYTVSGLATARGITINTNFGTFTKEFKFYYSRLLDLYTNMWYTVFDGDGELYFLKPERDSNSVEIANFSVLVKTTSTDKSVDYEGESGAGFTIAVDTKNIVSATIDSTIKQMTINKYNANINRMIISTYIDVNVLDYIIDNGDVYIILSKKLVSGENETPLYECRCVKEVAESLSFTGADVVNPTHYAITPADIWHYVGTAGEPSFNSASGWANFGGGYQDLRFRVDANNFVHIEGLVKSGTSNILFTLPTAYRPPKYVMFPNWVYDGTNQKAGNIQIYLGGNVYLNTTLGTNYQTVNCIFGLGS